MGSWSEPRISYARATVLSTSFSLVGILIGGAIAGEGVREKKRFQPAHIKMLVTPSQGVRPFLVAGDTITWYEKSKNPADAGKPMPPLKGLYFYDGEDHHDDKGSENPCEGRGTNPCKIKRGMAGHTAIYGCPDCQDPTLPMGSASDTSLHLWPITFLNWFVSDKDEQPAQDAPKDSTRTDSPVAPGMSVSVYCKQDQLKVSKPIVETANSLGVNVAVTWLQPNPVLDGLIISKSGSVQQGHQGLETICNSLPLVYPTDGSDPPACLIQGKPSADVIYDYTVSVKNGCKENKHDYSLTIPATP